MPAGAHRYAAIPGPFVKYIYFGAKDLFIEKSNHI